MLKNSPYKLLLPILCIFLLAIWIQANMLIAGDIGWLLLVGKRLLTGGKYYRDFFEVNPPMSIYLYLPAIGLAKIFPWGISVSEKIYSFAIATISFSLCYNLTNKLFTFIEKNVQAVFLLGLAAVFLLLPANEFGQREHLTIMLTFPYLLLATLRSEGKTINPLVITLIGLLAGIGFNIKPHFLLVWASIELYLAYNKKNIFYWLRLESIIVISSVIVYVATIFFFTPEYLYQVLPLITPIYYLVFSYSWLSVLTHPAIVLWITLVFLYLSLKEKSTHKTFADILFIANTGFLLVYISQRAIWHYHAIPPLAITSPLLIYLVAEYFNNDIKNRKPFLPQYGTEWMLFSFAACITFLALCLPFLLAFGYTKLGFVHKNDPKRIQLINFIKEKAQNKSILFFTTQITTPYPLINDLNIDSASRFPCYWILPGILLLEQKNKNDLYYREKSFFLHAVTEDIAQHKPTLILVFNPFDYFDFFLPDARFRELWENYRYKQTIGRYSIYELKTP